MAQQTLQQTIGPEKMADALSNFTLELYRKISNNSDATENVFLSPYSVSAALMLTMLGCRGNSESQLMAGLCLERMNANVHSEYKLMRDSLISKSGENFSLSVANRVYARLGLNIADEFKANALMFYGSDLELLDFVGDSEGSRENINKWVERQTNHKIKDLIPQGGINAMSLMVLTNAIHFKGNWDRKFNPEDTKMTPFRITESDSEEIPMMNMKKEKYISGMSEKWDCKMLQLPYKGEELHMIVILPNQVSGLENLEQNLTINMLKELRNEMYEQDTIVALPKFKLECSFQLVKVLSDLGITDIFSSQKADFSRMFSDTPENVAVSDVIHKSFIEVNEEGTEAAAATAVMIRMMCMPSPPLEFIADHPFLFFIEDKETETILFIGRFAQPPK